MSMRIMVPYDKFYLTRDLFGTACPELIQYFQSLDREKVILDMGCGQGRDLIPLVKLGFYVIGIDESVVGIEQIKNSLPGFGEKYSCIQSDMYEYSDFHKADVVLFDSLFHFYKRDYEKETGLIKKVISLCRKGTRIVFCIQDNGGKVKKLKQVLETAENRIALNLDQKIIYTFSDSESGSRIETKYRIVAAQIG